jgi:hypothetical protein
MRADSIWTAGLVGLAVWSAAPAARAQFQAPQNSREYEDTGTLEGVQGGFIKIRDSKNDSWVLETSEGTKITVTGEADRDFLHSPALHVQFTGQIDKKGVLQKAIEAIEIFSAEGKSSLGLFVPAEGDAPPKPVRSAASGTFLIRGRLVSYKNGQVVVSAGSRKITGNVSDEAEVKLNVDDPGLGQAGDAVKVKAWYYDKSRPVAALNQPGSALAEEITITLAKPLAYSGRKPRANDKASKPTAKSSHLSK